MTPVVWIRKGTDGEQMARDLLADVQADAILRGRSRVVVKLNITGNLPPETGVITSPSVLDGTLAFLHDHGIRDVVVAEGGGDDVTAAFHQFGYRQVAQRHGVPLIDLNHDEAQWVPVPDPLAVERFSIVRTVLECDAIVNLPCLKVHNGEAVVTLCMKNMMGFIQRDRRVEMHQHFADKIVDLLKIVRPDVSLVDGLVGRTWGEIHGEPVGMELMLAGTDCVATDAVGAAVMGMDGVPHILNAARHGLGVADLGRIEVRGEPVAAVRRPFRRRGWQAERFGGPPPAG